jgi:V/A-type H+-transporting ATPase subunit I
MPIVRVVEYKVALPADYAPDLLLGLGKLGYFMPLTRPSTLPSPRLPQRFLDRVRKLEDTARELSRVLQEYSVDPPSEVREIKVESFDEALSYALEEGTELLTRINQYLSSIGSVRAELDQLRRMLDVADFVVGAGDLRFLSIDVVPLVSRDFGEFKRAVESYGGEVALVEGRQLALVVYPSWLSGDIGTVYRIFGVSPMKVPGKLDPLGLSCRWSELSG